MNISNEDFIIENGVLKKYTGKSAEVNVPDGVTEIYCKAFCQCREITSVHLPDSLTCINAWAFILCSNLKSINIPDSVDFIGEGAFEDCDSLSEINIPGKITKISEECFFGCCTLSSIDIPSGVTSIGCCAFSSCDSLAQIYTGDNVTKICGGAFENCISLENITFSDKLEHIGGEVFHRCESLKNLNIPDSAECDIHMFDYYYDDDDEAERGYIPEFNYSIERYYIPNIDCSEFENCKDPLEYAKAYCIYFLSSAESHSEAEKEMYLNCIKKYDILDAIIKQIVESRIISAFTNAHSLGLIQGEDAGAILPTTLP